MAELTELEKRKLLRERRAAKFLKGGASDRLNKITGSNNSSLSASSPLDSSSSLSSTPTSLIVEPTPEHIKSKRISQSFTEVDHDQDPAIEDISSFIPKKSPISDPLNEADEPSNQDLEKILQQVFQNGIPSTSESSSPFGPDDFFLKMMQQQNSAQQQQREPQQQDASFKQNQAKFKKFKNYFILFRITLILSLLLKFFVSFDLRSSSIEIIYHNEFASKFNQYFIILEVLFFVIHFINIQKYEFHPGGGLISSVLPLISLFVPPNVLHFIRLIPSYMDIYQILQFDISLVILFFGIVSIL